MLDKTPADRSVNRRIIAVDGSPDFVRRPAEAARRLGVSVRTLRRLELRGEICATRVTDRCKGFRDSEIRRFLDSREAFAPSRDQDRNARGRFVTSNSPKQESDWQDWPADTGGAT